MILADGSSGRTVVGRFAPSPTGDLHFGSLVAALGSYLSAKAAGGAWIVRMEDIDTPRVVPGSADRILKALETLRLVSDVPVVFQSTRTEAYLDAFERLRVQGFAYRCVCSRAVVARAGRMGVEGPIYPGTCRHRSLDAGSGVGSFRLSTEGCATDAFVDRFQGPFSQNIELEVGDFPLRRNDGIFSYHLAVVVDDAAQGVTEVVRGCDLLFSTPRQRLLARRLGLPEVEYAHLPLAVSDEGDKLSKSAGAAALDMSHPAKRLVEALRFLGQEPPVLLERAWPTEVLEWGVEHFSPEGCIGRREGRRT